MSGPTKSFDTIVIGLGAMGSSALYHLARRGQRVLGLDRYSVPNSMGSSHGGTRIMRLAYFQDPRYVAMARRAREAWRALEAESGQRLFFVTGTLDAGIPGTRILEGARASCVEHGLTHEVLDGAAVRARWPGYGFPDEMQAVYQPDGGFLLAERCIETYVASAKNLGAGVQACEPVSEWKRDGSGFVVRTSESTYHAAQIVVTSGPWASSLVAEVGPKLYIERQVVGWFEPRRPELFTADRFPVFNVEWKGAHLYGIPASGSQGFKCGRDGHLRERGEPDSIRRECNAGDEQVIREHGETLFPLGMGALQAIESCLFTGTPDKNFIIDSVPDTDGAWMAVGFSGHGFKFASVVGDILADLVTRGASTTHDIAMFRWDRFRDTARHYPTNDTLHREGSRQI